MRVKKLIVGLVFFIAFSYVGSGAFSNNYSKEVNEWLQRVKELYHGKTITLAVVSHPSIEAFQKLGKEFSKLTGIKINWDVMEEGALANKVLMEWTGHTHRYDLIMSCPEYTPGFVDIGALVPLDSYLKNVPSWFDFEDLVPAYRDMLKYKGKSYGIPFAGESMFFMYRKDLFAKYGKTVPQTYQEVLDLAKFFNNRDINNDGRPDINGIVFRARRGWEFTYMWSVFIFPFGGMILDPDTGLPVLDSKGTVDSLKYMIELSKYAPMGLDSFSFPESWTNFMMGRSAMSIECTAAATEIENPKKSLVVGKIGYSKMPKGPAGAYSGVWGWGFSLSMDSKNKDAAWDLAMWLTSKLKQMDYLKYGGAVTRVSGLENPELRTKYPYYQAIEEALKQASDLTAKGLGVVPKTPKWMTINDIIGEYGSLALVGKLTPEQACEKMNEEALKVIKE